MKAESTILSGRLVTGTTVAETDRRVSARREACPGRQNEPPPARSLPGFSRTGFGAGAVPTSRRTRRLRLAALRAWGARDADATVLRLHRNDHVGAAPVDLDVVAAIAALADVLGGSSLVLAQRGAVDPVEDETRHLRGLWREGGQVEPPPLEEEPDAGHHGRQGDRRHHPAEHWTRVAQRPPQRSRELEGAERVEGPAPQ